MLTGMKIPAFGFLMLEFRKLKPFPWVNNSTMKSIAILSLSLFLGNALPGQDLYDESTVRDLRITFSQSNWWQLLDQNRPTESYIEADLEVDGINYPQVGVRFKGNSSASVWPSEKMPFKIKMDHYVATQDLYGFDTINLGNAFMDPTFCREVVTYHVMREFLPAPKANFVRLWLNGAYWGIYNNTEQVSGEFLDEWFPGNDGNRYKCDPTSGGPGTSSTLTWLGSSTTSYYSSYQLKSDSTGTEWQDLVNLCDALNNGSLVDLVDDVDDHLRIDRALWYLAAENIFVNRDSYIESGHNYYIYNDPDEGRFSTIPWDSNEAFGNFGMGKTVNQLQQLPPLENYGKSKYPLITRLLNTTTGSRGRAAYFANYREMLERSWDWTIIGTLVSQYQALIEADVIADTKKLYSLQDFYDNVTQDVVIGGGPGGRTSCGLQPFVVNRRAYLTGLPELSSARPEFSDLAVLPADPTNQDTVAVIAKIQSSTSFVSAAVLLWRAGKSGAYNESIMYDDGAHGDGASGDGVWGGIVPPQAAGTSVYWYMLAWTPAGNATHYPWQAEESPEKYAVNPSIVPNGIMVNEFLALNDTGATDEAGEYDDWIEIINTTSSSVDLSGWHLSDDSQLPTKWMFPSGTTISAGQVVLVWADNDLTQGPLHANFKLSGDGEEILLVDSDGVTARDFLAFSKQESDISTGRIFDGDDQWVTFSSPTANASNEQSCGYRAFDQLDPMAHGLTLQGSGSPAYGGSIDILLSGAAAGSTMTLYVSLSPSYLEEITSAGVVLINPFQLVFQRQLSADLNGEASLTTPLNNPALIGRSFYAQGHLPSSVLGEMVSNALEVTICP